MVHAGKKVALMAHSVIATTMIYSVIIWEPAPIRSAEEMGGIVGAELEFRDAHHHPFGYPQIEVKNHLHAGHSAELIARSLDREKSQHSSPHDTQPRDGRRTHWCSILQRGWHAGI